MFGFKKKELPAISKEQLERFEKDQKLFELNTPRPMPVGMKEFEEWSDKIIEQCGLDTVERHSLKFSLAAMVLQLSNQECYKANSFFVNQLRKSAANQIAHAVIQKLKEEQAEREAAEKAKKAAEAPAPVTISAVQ